MQSFDVAHVREQGVDLIIVFVDELFGTHVRCGPKGHHGRAGALRTQRQARRSRRARMARRLFLRPQVSRVFRKRSIRCVSGKHQQKTNV